MIEIKIDSVEQAKTSFGKKITLVSGNKKYIFYDTKKDGGLTKAYEQFKNADFGAGDSCVAEVDEQPKSFMDEKTKKQVNYTERRIMYFNEGEQGPGTAKNGQNLPQDESLSPKPIIVASDTKTAHSPDLQVLARLEGLEKRVSGIEGELNDRKNEGNPFNN